MLFIKVEIIPTGYKNFKFNFFCCACRTLAVNAVYELLRESLNQKEKTLQIKGKSEIGWVKVLKYKQFKLFELTEKMCLKCIFRALFKAFERKKGLII